LEPTLLIGLPASYVWYLLFIYIRICYYINILVTLFMFIQISFSVFCVYCIYIISWCTPRWVRARLGHRRCVRSCVGPRLWVYRLVLWVLCHFNSYFINYFNPFLLFSNLFCILFIVNLLLFYNLKLTKYFYYIFFLNYVGLLYHW